MNQRNAKPRSRHPLLTPFIASAFVVVLGTIAGLTLDFTAERVINIVFSAALGLAVVCGAAVATGRVPKGRTQTIASIALVATIATGIYLLPRAF